MKIRYFAEADTVYIELTNKLVIETEELNENAYIDLDEDGNLVAITLEHAREMASMDEFSFQQIVAEQFTLV